MQLSCPMRRPSSIQNARVTAAFPRLIEAIEHKLTACWHSKTGKPSGDRSRRLPQSASFPWPHCHWRRLPRVHAKPDLLRDKQHMCGADNTAGGPDNTSDNTCLADWPRQMSSEANHEQLD
jgi:hypothetical protein